MSHEKWIITNDYSKEENVLHHQHRKMVHVIVDRIENLVESTNTFAISSATR